IPCSSPERGSRCGCPVHEPFSVPPKSLLARHSSSYDSSTGSTPASANAQVLPACAKVCVLTMLSATYCAPPPSCPGPGSGSIPLDLATSSSRTNRLRYHSALPSPVNQL